MENKTYKLGQEFSKTDRTGNQTIYNIKITKIKETSFDTQYRLTFYFNVEQNDGTYKKSQHSSWHNAGSINLMKYYGSIVEKN